MVSLAYAITCCAFFDLMKHKHVGKFEVPSAPFLYTGAFDLGIAYVIWGMK